MVLQTNSIERAIGAANFLAPYLGAECTAIRCRIVNRLFAAEEGRLEELIKTLDHNVTVIDPGEAEAAFAQDFSGVRTMAGVEQIAAERVERRLQRKEDVRWSRTSLWRPRKKPRTSRILGSPYSWAFFEPWSIGAATRR